MLKSKKIPIEDISDKKVNLDDTLENEDENERQELLTQFLEFTKNAQKADLRDKDELEAMLMNHSMKKMGTAWLERLASL